ncbi:late gene transcription factor VLTF-3 [Carp edema virus]|nr:late gene transcription factor VLTF-3 [Carp edema virus]
MEKLEDEYFKNLILEIEPNYDFEKVGKKDEVYVSKINPLSVFDSNNDYFNYSLCQRCHINSVIETSSEFYCTNCEHSSEIENKKTKTNTSSFITNKSIHYRNVIKRLLTTFCDESIIDEIKEEIIKNNMELEDVDSNFINKKLKSKKLYANKDYKMVFEILSRINNEYIDEINENQFELISDIFKELAIFIQKEKNQKSINYNFFLHKIFSDVNISKHLQPQIVKNSYKNNVNLLTWKNFVKYYNTEIVPRKIEKRREFFIETKYVFDDKFDNVLFIT